MQLIKKIRGKTSVVATGDRKRLLARLKQLRASTKGVASGRGGKKNRVVYSLVEDSKEIEQEPDVT